MTSLEFLKQWLEKHPSVKITEDQENQIALLMLDYHIHKLKEKP